MTFPWPTGYPNMPPHPADAFADERIREKPCGCRYDAPTGVITHYCREHEKPDARR